MCCSDFFYFYWKSMSSPTVRLFSLVFQLPRVLLLLCRTFIPEMTSITPLPSPCSHGSYSCSCHSQWPEHSRVQKTLVLIPERTSCTHNVTKWPAHELSTRSPSKRLIHIVQGPKPRMSMKTMHCHFSVGQYQLALSRHISSKNN